MILLALALHAHAASEEEVFEAWSNGEFLTAGRLADELLADKPSSMTGNFVKGYVLWKEEGEHAGARHYLDKADATYARRNKSGTLPEDGWRMHLRIMEAKLDILSEMGLPEEELALMEVFNQDFSPGVDIQRAWPLMRLGRYPKAREVALAHVDAPEDWKRGAALNSMCAIESEALQRVAAFEWCKKALDHERSGPAPDVTIDANNAAGSALGVLDFDTSLDLAREATTGSSMGVANPYQTLVIHYTRAADGSRALKAVEGMVDWRSRQPASMRDLARSSTDEVLALFLYAAGRPHRARELIDRAIQFPDRAGLTSSEPLQAEGRHAALRLLVRRLEAERADEEAATKGFFARVGHWLGSWLPDTGVWEDRATLRAALTDSRRQRATFRVYLDGGLGLEPWLLVQLADDIGHGVFHAAVDEAADEDAVIEEEPPPSLDPIDAYYDALRAGAAFSAGDWSEVRALAEPAWTRIPEADALLRAELAAMIAESAWRRGDEKVAIDWFGRAIALDPGALRRLGIALPARVSGAGGAVADDVETLLGRSPRLRYANGAFDIAVTGSGSAVSICLRDPYGAQIGCSNAGAPAVAEGDDPPSEWELAQHHVLTWTERTFALPTGSALIDLDSLDGTTLRQGQRERELLDKVIEGL
ncbi:MAG: hypothetical protein EP330_21130 [Deltaproteobacteria bacterium]|nr:MAG: hypothetical protein EP330_21130 [Deltaproteobacteria bacterium]